MLFYDFEVYFKDWLVVIKDTDTRRTYKIVNDYKEIRRLYDLNKNNIWVGFNSRNYDQYILKGILLGMNPKAINNHIIVKNLAGWQFSKLFSKLQLYNYDVMTDRTKGLKQLEGFMGNNIMETAVDFNINRKLTEKEIEDVLSYCEHDVIQTMYIFINRKEEFESHMSLIRTFNLPLNYISKTKAQLAAIILEASMKECEDEFNITILDKLRIKKYSHIVHWYKNSFNRDYSKNLDIDVSGITHTFGWGGLHGAKCKYKGEGIFINSDVVSFYPSLMIEYGFLSRNISHPEKYKEIRDKRLELKEANDPKQLPYKIILNSTYGASKDKYNNLYDPLMANNVCVNGQLLLLDLIEHLEPYFELIQSNTDGVIFKLNCHQDIERYKEICRSWEQCFRMKLEHNIIHKVVQKDVNNYIIVVDNGTIKYKGAYVKDLNKLDNDLPIVNKAVKDYFIKEIPVEETINGCNNLIEFQKIVKVSNKYKYAIHGNKILNEKILRVFASNGKSDLGIYKVKNNKDKLDKIAGTPERCFIDNGDVKNKKIPLELDKRWYIYLAKRRISDFVE